MDFAYYYTDEQEKFRQEVSAWLDTNAPAGRPVSSERWADVEESLQAKLGSLGWLAPTAPPELGGGGSYQTAETQPDGAV